MCFDDMTLAHVSHTEHESQLSVPLTDDRMSAEQKCLGALLGSRELGKHHSHHERLDHHSCDTLQAHDEDSGGTILLGVARPVPWLKTITKCSGLL